jgi:2-polyprenyl-3-methyl-5-hydroxy-6-metoxy-1,4-benzoquinol methylase
MTASFWDKRSQKYDDAIKKHDPIFQRTLEATRSLLGDSETVLDFACASGEIAIEIAPNARRVCGIDTSERMIELANKKSRQRQVENITFDQMDEFDQLLKADSFSTAVAFSVFHLVEDPSKTLARLHELLRPSGLLISQTPCLGERIWSFRIFIGLLQRFGIAPLIHSLTFAHLEALVSGNGFEIIEKKIWDDKTKTQWVVARKKSIS